jgi:hypothetical protein
MSDKMKTKIHEFAGGESQGLNYPKPNASNSLNGRVFSLTGLRHTPSGAAITELSFGAFWQENAKETALFNKLQMRHLDANNPVAGGNSIQ